MKLTLGAILIFGLLTSCVYEGEVSQRVNRYYNIDSLLSSSVAKTIAGNAQIYIDKNVFIDGNSEQKTILFDSLTLSKEMDVFRLLDINQPNLTFSYNISQTETETLYQLKENEKQEGVLFLKINTDKKHKTIEGLFRENNSLYYTSRTLKLELTNGLLSSYELIGEQKLLLKDTSHFSIKAIILN